VSEYFGECPVRVAVHPRPDTRAGFAVALSESIEAVLQGVESEFQGTIEQFRLAGDHAEVFEASELAKSAAREAQVRAAAPGASEASQISREEQAMTVLAAFLKPGGLGPTDMADVRSLAGEGERLRGRSGLTGGQS
jgi:hypothetical protein